MIEQYFSRTPVIDRLRLGPLGPYLDNLATALHQQGYTRHTIRRYLWSCDRFGQWLSQQGYPIAEVHEALVARYVNGRQQRPAGRGPKATDGLSHLLTLWRQQALLPPRTDPPPATEVDQWLVQYAQYLEQVRGVAAGTRLCYLRLAKRFLIARFSSGPVTWSALQAHDITTFVHQEVITKRGTGRKMPGIAVRALLRFLVFRGELRPGLEAAVFSPRQWTHATLPQRLTAAEVERVLATHNGGTPKDLRNHAILLLLARLGLRSHEVVALRLEDIDWQKGCVLIRPGKTRHERLLPLVQDVGSALAAYLLRGRPATDSRIVFLHCRAPFRPLSSPTAIGRMATRALVRAGLADRPRLGAHLFRHTAASQMVNRGASFKEVADVLGHQSLESTGLYAKLDLAALASIALPWMGER